MATRYDYPHRALFRKRLIDKGMAPQSATSYETAILNETRANHLVAVQKWDELMGDTPYPGEYFETSTTQGETWSSAQDCESVIAPTVEQHPLLHLYSPSPQSCPALKLREVRRVVDDVLNKVMNKTPQELYTFLTAIQQVGVLTPQERIEALSRFLITQNHIS